MAAAFVTPDFLSAERRNRALCGIRVDGVSRELIPGVVRNYSSSLFRTLALGASEYWFHFHLQSLAFLMISSFLFHSLFVILTKYVLLIN